MRHHKSTRIRANRYAEATPPLTREESATTENDWLAVTRKARGLIDQNDPLALEIFNMGRRHGQEIQESRSQIAMLAFMEGIDPNYQGNVSYVWTRLANACRIWSDPTVSHPVQPRTPATHFFTPTQDRAQAWANLATQGVAA
ncbi:hypothetical protein [Kocuria sp.]|uniref:hypothetical protein n=1 Tax=Kocuria sp. TaxID=1871328 RepID=UPI0026E0A77F|nr:hypothetical protein [Kocuria sp.]MDO5618765.1 hypothetical protein [Kocuria sp.]